MRPGLAFAGVDHLKEFVSKGGLLITSEDTAQFAIDLGLAPGVFVAPRGNVRVVGSVLGRPLSTSRVRLPTDTARIWPSTAPMGWRSLWPTPSSNRHIPTEKDFKRPTGRGGPAG